MEHKSINEMSLEEILRRQLELLAERSQNALDEDLPALTKAMSELYTQLSTKKLCSSFEDAFLKAAELLTEEKYSR